MRARERIIYMSFIDHEFLLSIVGKRIYKNVCEFFRFKTKGKGDDNNKGSSFLPVSYSSLIPP